MKTSPELGSDSAVLPETITDRRRKWRVEQGKEVQLVGVDSGHDAPRKQQNLQSLHFKANRGRGEKVVLIHHFHDNDVKNPATAVQLLDGSPLGTIPSDLNQSVELQEFMAKGGKGGEVGSAGPCRNYRAYGGSIKYWDGIHHLTIVALPERLRKEFKEQILDYPEEALWSVEKRVLKMAHKTCAISGSRGDELVVVPIWQLNDCHKIASLEGFQAVSKKLKEAQDFLLQDEAAAEFAIPVFMAMNRWTREDVLTYRNTQLRLIKQRKAEGWTLDIASVEEVLDVILPKGALELKPEMCIATPPQDENTRRVRVKKEPSPSGSASSSRST